MESKVLFIDVDGTLVDYHGRLPDSAAKALAEAREAGHLVLFCSGRAVAEMPESLWDLKPAGYIGGNGNYIEIGDVVVLQNALSAADCRAIVDWLAGRGTEFYLEANAGLFASPGFREAAAPVMVQYTQRKGQPPPGADLGFHGMVYGGELYRDDVMKISYLLDSYDDHLAAKAEFPGLQHGVWGGRGADALFGDVGVAGVTKAIAVQAVLDYLKVDRDRTIAFGDAAVDLPMFAECGFKVAMGNASDDVKEAADLITDDVEHDGLANALAALGLS